jgi:hypothetical protein
VCKDLWSRCVVRIRSEWNSVSEHLSFWTTDYGDTEEEKLALVKEMAQWCFECQPPKDKKAK